MRYYLSLRNVMHTFVCASIFSHLDGSVEIMNPSRIKEIQRGNFPYLLICDIDENTQVKFKDVGSGIYVFDLYVYKKQNNQWILVHSIPRIYHHTPESDKFMEFFYYKNTIFYIYNHNKELLFSAKIE